MVEHHNATDPYIHEPKGASTASDGTVYVSDGVGSGSWTGVGVAGIDIAALEAQLEADAADGSFNVSPLVHLSGEFENVSSDTQRVVAVPFDAEVVSVQFTLGGAISGADDVVQVRNSGGSVMGDDVTVLQSGSAKGDTYTFLAETNNTIPAGSWFEITNTAASTGAQILAYTATLQRT